MVSADFHASSDERGEDVHIPTKSLPRQVRFLKFHEKIFKSCHKCGKMLYTVVLQNTGDFMEAKNRLLNRMKCVEKLAIVNANAGVLEQLAGGQYRTELNFFNVPEDQHLAVMIEVHNQLVAESREAHKAPGFPQTIWPQ
jgi:hypothetical protein